MKSVQVAVAAVLMTLFLASPVLAGDVTISVAVSLKDVINELTDGYAKHHPGVRFFKNFGASGALAKQIENGAPADVYISANLEWMNYLKARNLVDSGSIAVFAYNTLVFAGTDGTAASMQDLPKLERIAIGSPRSVPAGEYAMGALRKAGLDRLLARKLIMANDVRECLMYADRGEVDGSFVYKTDALQAKRARILFIVPPGLYPRVTYPLALTLAGANNRDASAFVAYLHGSEAKAVLVRYGFTPR